MTINDPIRDQKLQYDINRIAAEISALSSGKILPSNQQQIIEQATFTYYPSGIAFEKQTKTIEDQGETGSGFERFKTKRTNKINRRNFSRRLWVESVEIKNKLNKIKQYKKGR